MKGRITVSAAQENYTAVRDSRPTAITKVEHYKWTVADEPGTFLMVPKDQLKIDSSYQRAGSNKRALVYAQNWSWIACGTLIVADRDNEFYVIDGQHRKLAADKRADIKELPCMVFRVENLNKEAQGFLDVNDKRRALLTIDKFNALLATRDETAVYVNGLIEDHGRRIYGVTTATTVKCVGSLMRMATLDRKALDKTYPLANELCQGQTFSATIIEALWWLERRSNDEFSLTRNPWRSKLLNTPLSNLHDSIARARAYYRNGGAAIYGRGVATALNKGMRRNKIDLGDGDHLAEEE